VDSTSVCMLGYPKLGVFRVTWYLKIWENRPKW